MPVAVVRVRCILSTHRILRVLLLVNIVAVKSEEMIKMRFDEDISKDGKFVSYLRLLLLTLLVSIDAKALVCKLVSNIFYFLGKALFNLMGQV